MIVYITVVILIFTDGNSPIITNPHSFDSPVERMKSLRQSLSKLPDGTAYEAACIPVIYGEDA